MRLMVKTTRSCESACAAAVIFDIRERAHREPTFYICLLQPLCPSLSFFSFLLNFGYPSGHIEPHRAEKRPKLHGCAPCVILNHASHLKKKRPEQTDSNLWAPLSSFSVSFQVEKKAQTAKIKICLLKTRPSRVNQPFFPSRLCYFAHT